MNHKEKIDYFYTKNYPKLINTADKVCKNTNFDYNDLVAELYMYLIDNEAKISGITINMATDILNKDEDPLLLYSCKWLYNNIRLFKANKKASNFQAKYSIKNQEINLKTHDKPEMDIHTINKDDDIFNKVKYYQEEIDIENYVYNQLNQTEKIIFKLRFKQNSSIEKLLILFPNVTRYGLNQICNELKSKIQILYLDKLNEIK